MMDAAKYEILKDLETSGSMPGINGPKIWEPYRSVYLFNKHAGPVSGEDDGPLPSLVLKPLKRGLKNAFLTGELLRAGERFFQNGMTDHDAGKRHRDGFLTSGAILPPIVRPANGGGYIWSPRSGRFLLTGLLKGREADYNRVADLQAAIRTMKTFHWFTQSLMMDNPRRWSLLKIDLLAEWRKRLREMAVCREMALREKGDWSRRYLKYWPEFCYQALEAVRELKSLTGDIKPGFQTGWDVICYHDWAYHNVIVDDGKAFLIDFDDIIADRPVHDRANLIGRYLRLNRWSEQSLVTIMKNFDRFYEWRPGELHWLWIYMTFPYEYWILGRQYFIEKQPWSLRYYQDQWERKIALRLERRRVLQKIGSEF